MQEDVQKVTLHEAHRAFLDDLKSKQRATSTVLAYGKDVEQLVTFVGGQHKYEPGLVN